MDAFGISASEKAEEDKGERAVVNTGDSTLNLRKSASTSGKVIRKLKSGTVVYIQEEEGTWARVIVETTGETGWCNTKHLKRDAKADK